MCGIFAYISPEGRHKKFTNATDICLSGLQLLEYRGYDSSGIAGMIDGKIRSCKRKGKVGVLKDALSAEPLPLTLAIAHTRWATHGTPSQQNAHPHLDQYSSLAIVHNGIIENHHKLREKLTHAGMHFKSDTDSEVIAALVSLHYNGNLEQTVLKAIKELQGSFAIAIIHKNHPNLIVGASRESPLVVGIDSVNGGAYLSSDANSFNGKVLDILYLKNNEVITLHNDSFKILNSYGVQVKKDLKKIHFNPSEISKNGFDHYMLKEIFEQPKTVQFALKNRINEEALTPLLDTLKLDEKSLKSLKYITILGCGTSFHAGLIAASIIEEIARIPVSVEIASEFRYTQPLVKENSMVIAISQSGETADTLAAVRLVKSMGIPVLSLCNIDRSSIVREVQSTLFLNAGIEMSVCSTKAFTSQLVTLILLSTHLANVKKQKKSTQENLVKELIELPKTLLQVLTQSSKIELMAKKYCSFKHMFFVGRRYMYPTCLEAALKLKEISYIDANGYPAGEMKHGPIALINPMHATVGLCGDMHTFDKMISNLREIKARNGRILLFCPQYSDEVHSLSDDIIWMPKTSDIISTITYSVACQLFAYYTAKNCGTNIDQPRNLAKSVTVE